MSGATTDPPRPGQAMPMVETDNRTPINRDARRRDAELEELKYGARSVVSLIAPVSLCMLLVVVTVRSVTYFSTDSGIYLPYVVFDEKGESSDLLKFGGALVNALIIIAVVAVMTFLLVCCYKHRCYKLITVWLVFSTVILLFFFSFTYWQEALTFYNVPMDWVTTAFVIYNFGMVGLVSIFWRSPLRLQQAYLIITSALMALTFMKRLPLWTTWVLLGCIAIWDLIAVLCPKGPLRMLVETAQERNEPLFPALIYSSRATMVVPTLDMADRPKDPPPVSSGPYGSTSPAPSLITASSRSQLINTAQASQSTMSMPVAGTPNQSSVSTPQTEQRPQPQQQMRPPQPPQGDDEDEGIKLGLGDFIFYSILVGTAATQKEWGTVFSCFYAILMGLCMTLLLLAVFKKALPALPISIALGILFYFVTSLVVIPLTDELARNMLFV
eukprot:comp20661_c0_seq1/m.26813 comp20661_c0_seq1/g.26813  ORF comp20661_c0_seq1/g.26813 comp20661_c0_seq1/m.26813 type:complete len:442 (-) comp20661_c0_seq1:489-1814(-)